ncbi:MAG: RhuM family protein [Anaeroplasmataceae bacterium]
MTKTKEIEKIEKNFELIKFEDGDFSLDVNVSPSENTVWLTQAQIAELYDRDTSVISRHIKNILLELECTQSNLQKMQITNSDKPIILYDLEMIISIGYKVKSKRGILFRRWANSILKQYLLNGYVINESRCIAHSDNLIQMNNDINNLNNRLTNVELRLDNINSINIFKNKLFYNGDLFEGYSFIKDLFSKALNRIVIIDAYLDYSVLEMLIGITIPITIYIYPSSTLTNKEINLFQANHNLTIIKTNKYHDRFIVIDNELYNIGSSIKDIGKKISHVSKLESIDIDNLEPHTH